jgi:hypothetical protein
LTVESHRPIKEAYPFLLASFDIIIILFYYNNIFKQQFNSFKMVAALDLAIEKFIADLDKDEQFLEVADIILNNSLGKIWMIGGGVYRSISANLHGNELPAVDRDFIVENGMVSFELPSGWVVGRNRHGNPKFIQEKTNRSIDYVPINTIHSILARNLAPTIENYLTGTPLNVQSITYDVLSKQVIGDVGLHAISEKRVRVNNYAEAIHGSERKGMTLKEYIQKIADSLGFKADI